MKRILIGVLALVVVVGAGFFGLDLYAQRRATREVEAAFEQIRSTGAKADHGKIAFDVWTRTLAIADIRSETASQPPVTMKIASVIARGVSEPEAGRIAATSIETRDFDIDAQAPAPSTFHFNYKTPKIVVKDYAGPARGERPPAGASPLAIYGFLLQQFATISASSVSVPTVTGAIDLGTAAIAHGEFTYAGMTLDGIKDGKIAGEKIGQASFKFDAQQAGQAQTMIGHLADIVASDIDIGAIAAVLDPQGTPDDHVRRLYRQVSVGPYDLTSSLGAQVHMDGITIDEAGLRPSKLQLPALLAVIARPATPQSPPSPAQVRALANTVADLWQGIVVKNEEMRGLSIKTPQGTLRLAGARADIQDGKLDFALDGLDAQTPQGPLKVGRFALKSLDMAGIMRMGAQFADPAHRPPPAQALELLKALQGAELGDVVAPYKNKQVKIDNVSLDWGQFVGPIPTRAHLLAKMNSPLDASNPALLPLLAAGIDTAAVDADLGLGWTENTGAFAVSPVKLDIANIVGASASVSLAHVPREVFTINPQVAMVQAAQIEAGGLELTLHDLGGVDLLIAQFARMQNVSREDARQAILAAIKAGADRFGSDNPDVAAAVDAISRFIATPHQTLMLKLTPRAKVPAMQLVQLLSTDPPSAAAQFRIDASTGM